MDNLVSIIFYFIFFAASATFLYMGQKYRSKTLTVFGLLIPILVAALRYDTGIDYLNYVSISDQLSTLSISEFAQSIYSSLYEPSLFLFSHISRAYLGNDIILFALYATIIIVPFYFAIKRINPKYVWLSTLLYLLIYFAPSMNAVRQYAAISVTFFATIFYVYSHRFQYRHKLLIFILLVLLATTIHSSAICMLVMPIVYWLAQKLSHFSSLRITLYLVIISAVAVCLIFPILLNIDQIPFLNRYSHYISWIGTSTAPVPNLIPKLVPVLLGIYFISRLKALDKNRNVFFYSLSYITLASSLLGFVIPYGYRLSDYFFIFQIPLFIAIIQTAVSSKQRHFYILAIITYAVIYFIYSSLINNSHGIFPYQTIFLPFTLFS